MYPRADVSLQTELPSAAQFWTPEPDDIDEYCGFGFFDNVWTIIDIPENEAREMLEKDYSVCHLVSGLAAGEAEFEAMATAVETGVADDPDAFRPDQLRALLPHLTETAALDGLDMGVAGLVYALSAAGMYPAASCRGHPGGWSSCPVVFVAMDRAHAETLQPLVAGTGCGFHISPARPMFLAIIAQSVEATLALAEAVLVNLNDFGASITVDNEPG